MEVSVRAAVRQSNAREVTRGRIESHGGSAFAVSELQIDLKWVKRG
jgi:hypothetical protein